MLAQDQYYEDLDTGVKFRVMGVGNGATICKNIEDGKLFVWSDDLIRIKNLQSIPKPDNEYIGTTQIRGGEIQDRTIT